MHTQTRAPLTQVHNQSFLSFHHTENHKQRITIIIKLVRCDSHNLYIVHL